MYGSFYAGGAVLLDLGEWDNAATYEVRVQTDEGSPVTLLAYTPTAGDYAWTLPLAAIDKSLIQTVRATGPGGVTTASAASYGPVLAPVVSYKDQFNDTLDFSSSGGSAMTRTINYIATSGVNQKLRIISIGSETVADMLLSATYDGGALGAPTYYYPTASDGGTYQHIAVWDVLDPTPGPHTVVVTRGAGSSARWFCRAMTVQDCAATVVDTDTFADLGGGPNYGPNTSPAIAGQAYDTSFIISAVGLTGANDTTTPDATHTQTGTTMWATGSTLMAKVMTKAASGPGAIAFSTTVSVAARRWSMFQMIDRPTPHEDVPPIYFFANEGNDTTGDGLTLATAWKSVDKMESFSPVIAGTEFVVKGGQWHRRVSKKTFGQPALDLDCRGTAAKPVKLRTHDGSEAWIGGDEILTGWASATTGETNSVASAAGAEKKTLGSSYPQMAFPCGDDIMCQPASWTRTGYPTSIYDWDMQVKGGDSYTHLSPSQVQNSDRVGGGNSNPPPSAMDPTKEMQCKAVYLSGTAPNDVYTWTVRVQHADIAAHYGSASPVGALLVFKTANIQNKVATITTYNQGSSYIEVTYTGGANRGPEQPSKQYWAILMHPLDLRKIGQFARIGDDVFVIWPAGTTTKSVAAHERSIRVKGNYIERTNVGSGRAVGNVGDEDEGSGNLAMVDDLGGDHVTWDGIIRVRQAINFARPAAVGNFSNPLTNFLQKPGSEIRVEQCYNHRGIHLGSAYGDGAGGAGILFSGRLWLEDCGRTGFYVAGGTGSYGVRVTGGLWLAALAAVHGNPISCYQKGHDVRIDGIFIADAPNFITSQTSGYTFARPPGKANAFGHMFAIGQRNIAASPALRDVNTPAIRIDGNESDTSFSDIWAFGVYTTAMQFFGGDNPGFELKRAALQSLSVPTGNGLGVTITATITTTGTNASVWGGTGQATITDDSNVDATATIYPPSNAVWEKMTRKDGGGYEAKQVGPADLGYTIPAYGGSITLAALSLVRPTIRGDWQAYRAIGTVAKAMPLSTLSLPAGVGDNNNFELDQGQLVPKIVLTKGSTYSVTVRQTNASATNAPYLDTAFSIPVV
jgi:hypothetical protein